MIEIMSNHWLSSFEGASERTVKAGENLFRRGDSVEMAFLVRKGRIFLRRALLDGGLLTLHTAKAGELVAEASLFADRYHCDAVTDIATTVALVDRQKLLSGLGALTPVDRLAVNALKQTTRELQSLRMRIEIMRFRKVADRLDAYLELFGPPDTGAWVQVADWIGASPPALYREIARRRKDGHRS